MAPTTPDQSERPFREERAHQPSDLDGPGRPEPDGSRGTEASRERHERRRRTHAPLVLAAAVAAVWAAVVSYLPVAIVMGLVRFSADAATVGGAARMGLAGWLLGHGVPLGTSAGPIGLPPLSLAALAGWRLVRAGVHASRAVGVRRRGSPGQALAVAVTVGVWYGMVGAIAGVAVGNGGPVVSPVRAGTTLAVFGAFASLVGALGNSGAGYTVARRTPGVLRDGLRAGLVAALLLVAAGATAAGLAVAVGGGEASDMIAAYRTGVSGQASITLISMAYAPNAAVWAAAYLLGPGFAIGVDSTVRTTEVTLGTLPAVPLLAGVPHGPVGGVGAALLVVPVVAGAAAGWLLARRRAQPSSRPAARDRTAPAGLLLASTAVAGPVAGALTGLAAVASSGPLGGGRLAEIGPVGWHVTAAATVLVTLGSLVGAGAARVFVRR